MMLKPIQLSVFQILPHGCVSFNDVTDALRSVSIWSLQSLQSLKNLPAIRRLNEHITADDHNDFNDPSDLDR